MANNIIGTVGIGAASVQPGYNQNDPKAKDYIKNRPGGYVIQPTFAIEWDGDMTGRETVVVENGSQKITYVKIADEAPSIEVFKVKGSIQPMMVPSTKYYMQITCEIEMSDGTTESEMIERPVYMGDDNYWHANTNGIGVIGILNGTLADESDMTLSKGLWVMVSEEMGK